MRRKQPTPSALPKKSPVIAEKRKAWKRPETVKHMKKPSEAKKGFELKKVTEAQKKPAKKIGKSDQKPEQVKIMTKKISEDIREEVSEAIPSES